MPRAAGRALRLETPADALALLATLGASPWLLRHHELVVEAAETFCDRIGEMRVAFDRGRVIIGAALHDVGKVVHPAEESAPGHEHEAAGHRLLLEQGVNADVARFTITHASWLEPDRTIEDLLVALADKLWKGKREESLEQRAVVMIADATHDAAWRVFDRLDAICEEIAAKGPERLARSSR